MLRTSDNFQPTKPRTQRVLPATGEKQATPSLAPVAVGYRLEADAEERRGWSWVIIINDGGNGGGGTSWHGTGKVPAGDAFPGLGSVVIDRECYMYCIHP
jgi:hypothetical protein